MKTIISIQFYRTLAVLGCLLIGTFAMAQKGKKAPEPPVSFGSLSSATFEKFKPTGMAIAIVKDGEVLYKGGFGTLDATTQKPMDTKALFNIASCSKAFTAACLALLVEQGKLSWNDKVIDYLPGFRLIDPWITAQITIRDLLCHRSGLETFYGDLLWYGTTYTDQEILARMRHIPLKKQFRSEFGYQNNMYMVAGLVIEKVSGKSWERFVTDHIFTPLGMTSTRASNDQLDATDLIAYGHIKGKRQEIFDFNGTKPAASIYSSVEDISKWMNSLLTGGISGDLQLLKRETIRSLWAAQTPIPVSSTAESWGIHFRAYALGWSTYDYQGRKVVEHDGGMPGYISKVCLVPEERLGIVLLNNGMDFQVNDALRYKLLDHVFKNKTRDWDELFYGFRTGQEAYEQAEMQKRAQGRIANTKPGLELSAYSGKYEDPAYGTATVEVVGGNLKLTFDPAKAIFSGVMEHWHFDTFKVQFKDDFLTYGLVTFAVGPMGEVEGFKIDLPSDDFQFFELDFKKKS